MKPTKYIAFIILAFGVLIHVSSPMFGETKLIIRFDDIGMCHSVNMAAKKLIEKGVVFSASVMFTCPWYKEAVEILKDHPEVGVGIHLTLNSEWKHYKWGPVLGAEVVPGLVDKDGYFWESEAAFAAANVKLEEVEKELRAQIERARATGLRIDYIDYHMLTAVSTPELRALVEKLAKENGLGISCYFGEYYQTMWAVPPDKKLNTLLKMLDQLEPGKLNLIVIHLGLENPEMQALVDMNNPDDPDRVSQHRQAELKALLSRAFKKKIKKKKVKLVTYRDVVSEKGLEAMKRPTEGE
ncbi:MAG: ChbG/HpnK family deacetylase [Candidatus Aminicenantes bacterium]|nr:ChbG/HpnK family deacetylase [Candidatus Aminicenantes bacterium]NIM83057.1 ChbG/HpnK family deacetylase [Candidatus Aminicenantes bacterium]NIN22436.1 ChbG/HpnK family deacetylase [Candidatus Aminicenantes bacterium]NIN46204.1 ChbG/HpnK family deacetylase [Candidatus Aminicenantes bacterium]NIN89041.1 ChbG/HpnK family deacetylase [Candidatus Aminicenantes bacterium]